MTAVFPRATEGPQHNPLPGDWILVGPVEEILAETRMDRSASDCADLTCSRQGRGMKQLEPRQLLQEVATVGGGRTG